MQNWTFAADMNEWPKRSSKVRSSLPTPTWKVERSQHIQDVLEAAQQAKPSVLNTDGRHGFSLSPSVDPTFFVWVENIRPTLSDGVIIDMVDCPVYENAGEDDPMFLGEALDDDE